MSKTADEVSEVVEALRTHGSDDCDEAADLLEQLQKRNEKLEGIVREVSAMECECIPSESFGPGDCVICRARALIQGVPNE